MSMSEVSITEVEATNPLPRKPRGLSAKVWEAALGLAPGKMLIVRVGEENVARVRQSFMARVVRERKESASSAMAGIITRVIDNSTFCIVKLQSQTDSESVDLTSQS